MITTSAKLAEREHQAYHDLVRFIKWLAYNNKIDGHWCMNSDDLEAELYFVFVKLVQRYIDKPYKEFLIIARTSLKNAIGTLRYKMTLTHRKQELYAESLDELQQDDQNNNMNNNVRKYYEIIGGSYSESLYQSMLSPETLLQITEDYAEKVIKLSDFDKRVLDALIGGNARLRLYFELQRDRKNFVYADPKIIIEPLIVARALCEDVSAIRTSFKRIKHLLAVGN